MPVGIPDPTGPSLDLLHLAEEDPFPRLISHRPEEEPHRLVALVGDEDLESVVFLPALAIRVADQPHHDRPADALRPGTPEHPEWGLHPVGVSLDPSLAADPQPE